MKTRLITFALCLLSLTSRGANATFGTQTILTTIPTNTHFVVTAGNASNSPVRLIRESTMSNLWGTATGSVGSTQMVTAAIGTLMVTGSVSQLSGDAIQSALSMFETNGNKYSQILSPPQIQTNNVLILPTNATAGVMVAQPAGNGTNQLAPVQLSAGQYVTFNGTAYVAGNQMHTGTTNETWLNLDFNPTNPTNTYIVTTSATNFTVSATNLHLLVGTREFSLVFPTNFASYALWFTNGNGITHKWMSATNATKTNTYHREVVVYASRTNEASVYQADNR